jgi:hypothetical protein
MSSSLFEYTPSVSSTVLPGLDETYDTSFLRPTVGLSDAGHYDIVLVESSDVKDQLDRVEEELKKLADFVRTEASKPRSPAETVQELPDPTDDVVMHQASHPAVVLLDLPFS